MFRNKYRPKTFEKFIGNESVIDSIRSNIDKIQTYLLSGERGCGKTTIARIIIRTLEIKAVDVTEINAADTTGVQDARSIIEKAKVVPYGNKKAFIIDECHRLTGNAQDALLKILEEPPNHVVFILCTTNKAKVIKTIQSRAFCYELKKLNTKQMRVLLKRVIKKEKIKLKDDVLKSLIRNTDGIPRDALVLLEAIKDLKASQAIELIKKGTEEDTTILELCRVLVKTSTKKRWEFVVPYLNSIEGEPETIRRSILGYLSKVLLSTNDPIDILQMMECFAEPLYDTGKAGLLYQIGCACCNISNE